MTTRQILASLPLAAAALLAACVPPPAESPPLPQPAPRPQPSEAPVELPTPAYDNWMDAPQTPGDWYYRAVPGGSGAFFGDPQAEPRFSVRCDRNARTVTLARAGNANGPLAMTIRAETRDRTLQAQPMGGEFATVAASLAAQDPLLEAIAFSKGRFAVEVAGMAGLYLPAYPEITRVIEDCR